MRNKIIKLITTALEELNEELEYDSLKSISENTSIYGGEFSIDSLSLVRAVADVENYVNEEFDTDVLLADEKAMSMRRSPYRTVGAFADFILEKVEKDHE